MSRRSAMHFAFAGLMAVFSSGTVLGAVTVSFPTAPSSDTVYDYYFGYPYMAVAGDTVTGYRSSAGLPAVNAVSVDILVNQTYLYCDTWLDFYFDGEFIGSVALDAYYYWTYVGGSVPVTLTNAEDHTIEIVLYSDVYWCSYPYISFVYFDEVYSTITMDLVGADEDGDGYYSIDYYGDDCDDRDADVHPGASETCNGVDDNCDGRVDEGVSNTYYLDADGDGYGTASSSVTACSLPSGYATGAGDCDDGNPDAHPGASETCNGVDDDCDGTVDEGLRITYYLDADSDGYGTSASTTQACDLPSGYASVAGDCDDGDAAVNPGAAEQCDSIDNDCDGAVDEGVANSYYLDQDGDGFGVTNQATQACTRPAGHSETPGDCDDGNASVYPSAPEQCDGADNDCDGVVDEDVQVLYYQDADGDGYGNPDVTVWACDLPSGHAERAGDCDDSDANVHPGAEESCNGVDDDCDGSVDEDVLTTYYRDQDGDGFGESGWTTQACDLPDEYAQVAGDCDDSDANVHPGAEEVCNDADDDCDGVVDDGLLVPFYQDQDGDGYGTGAAPTYACSSPEGYAPNAGDCDDSDASTFPGATETCDDKDNDCDGVVDEEVQTVFYQDADEDGYGVGTVAILACTAPPGHSAQAGDCDDSNADIHPGATEVCNGIDDDCDGAADEGVTTTFHPDADGDGYGDPARSLDACTAPDGYVEDDSDCRDSDPATYPGAQEACDGFDNDCDGDIDEEVQTIFYLDQDRDGFGDPTQTESACERPAGFTQDGSDCDDSDASIHPGAREACNGVDDDCDGLVDEEVMQTFYLDADEDGFGDAMSPSAACSQPDGYVANDADCDDSDTSIHPGADETCNERDDDCDGTVDEDVRSPWYPDADEDGFGAPDKPVYACSAPDGRVADNTDCDDSDPSIYPGAEETCDDGIDQDCDSYDLGCDQVDDDQDGFSEVDGDCDDSDASIHPGADETCDGIDNDCSGQPDDLDADEDGFISALCGGDDCDDSDPTIHPGADETCDGIDNDCSGQPDDLDADEDGFISALCGGDDCDDADPTVYPGAAELSNGQDDDCDGTSDEGTDAFDDDGDGYSEQDGDCDDTNPDVSPSAEELLEDGIDNDCDGIIDESPVTPTPVPLTTPSPTPGALTATPEPWETPATTPSATPGAIGPTATPVFPPTPGPWETPATDATPWSDLTTPTPGPDITPTLLEPTPTPPDLPPDSATPGFSDVPTPAAGEGEGCNCRTQNGPPGSNAGTLLLLGLAAIHGLRRRTRSHRNHR